MSDTSTVLIYSTCGLSLPHLAIEREIIEKHMLGFDRRILLKCEASLKSCYFNPVHNNIACAACRKRTKDNIEGPFDFDKVYALQKEITPIDVDFTQFKDVYDLMKYQYKGIDIGRGIGSSLISIKRDSDLDIKKYKKLILDLLAQAASLIDQIKELTDREKITDLLVFNGRFFELYPVLAFCKQNGINYYTHEKGANFSKYQVIKNNTVHSLDYRKQQLDDVWNAFEGDNVEVGEKWYTDKKSGHIKTETNYTKEQTSNQLPEGFSNDVHNVVIFNSSEDEYKSIKEWEHDLFTDQVDIIARICNALKEKSDIQFYLRFHPNMKGLADKQLAELNEHQLTNLKIIKPDSPISTYKLMLSADKVLSFGSRTSIEAAYWGIPSVIYGKSFYQSLNSLYNPTDFKSLIETIENKALKPKKGEDLLKAALFLQERGHKLEYAKIENKNEVYYKDKKLNTSVFNTLPFFSINQRDRKLWLENFKTLMERPLTFKDYKILK